MAPSVAVLNEGNVVYEPRNTNDAVKPSLVLHRSLHSDPVKIVGGKGNYLFTDDGRQIFDATVGAAVACLGHGNQRVKDAVLKQMDEVSYVHSLYYTATSSEALAKELIDGTNGKMARAYIISSGSEAMEAAMKLARQYYQELSPAQPRRTKFIARRESYHGITLGALSMSGHVARRVLYEPMLLPNISRVSPCNEYRFRKAEESTEQYVERLAQDLDDEFQRLGPETVCAFVAEPVVGAALGCVPSVPGYFIAMQRVCNKYGALLILDEVMSGMGRCGTLHVWQHEGVVPDIQTIGKGLGGGYAPIAGILINHRVIDVLEQGTGSFSHGQTYQGHPVACAAAAEVQKIIREQNLVANVAQMGALLGKGLKARLGGHPYVGDIRGRGLFWGIELVRDKQTKEPFEPNDGVANGIRELGMGEPYNISIYPGNGTVDGLKGDHVMFFPAYIVTREDVQKIVELAGRVVEDFFEQMSAKKG